MYFFPKVYELLLYDDYKFKMTCTYKLTLKCLLKTVSKAKHFQTL